MVELTLYDTEGTVGYFLGDTDHGRDRVPQFLSINWTQNIQITTKFQIEHLV